MEEGFGGGGERRGERNAPGGRGCAGGGVGCKVEGEREEKGGEKRGFFGEIGIWRKHFMVAARSVGGGGQRVVVCCGGVLWW